MREFKKMLYLRKMECVFKYKLCVYIICIIFLGYVYNIYLIMVYLENCGVLKNYYYYF